MNAVPEVIPAERAELDPELTRPLPGSTKVYISNAAGQLRVPMRELVQNPTRERVGLSANPPVYVYDTSGPYTDAAAQIDVRRGLPLLRAPWIIGREDTEVLTTPSS